MRSVSVTHAPWLEDEFWLARARQLARGREAALLLVRRGRLVREVCGSRNAVRAAVVHARSGSTVYLATNSRGVSRAMEGALVEAGVRVVGGDS
jgi:hypothetical protein